PVRGQFGIGALQPLLLAGGQAGYGLSRELDDIAIRKDLGRCGERQNKDQQHAFHSKSQGRRQDAERGTYTKYAAALLRVAKFDRVRRAAAEAKYGGRELLLSRVLR